MPKSRGKTSRNPKKFKGPLPPSANVRVVFDRLITLVQTGRGGENVELAEKVVALGRSNPEAHHLHGICLMQSGDMAAGVAAFKRAIALSPANPGLLNHCGVALCQTGQGEEGLAMLEKAVQLAPDLVEARNNYARALSEAGAFAKACVEYRKVVDAMPQMTPGWLGLMSGLNSLGRLDEALEVAVEAISKLPGQSALHGNLGRLLIDAHRMEEAESALRQAMALNPANGEAANNLGTVLEEADRQSQAIAFYRLATQHRPDLADGWHNLGNALEKTGNLEEASDAHFQALERHPQSSVSLAALIAVRRKLCQWDGLDDLVARLSRVIDSPDFTIAQAEGPSPFSLLSLPVTARQQRIAAEAHSARMESRAIRWQDQVGAYVPPLAAKGWRKLRIGYLSPDFREHPIAQLMAGVIDDHDRSRFEISCWSIGPVVESRFRDRIIAGSDRFESISDLPIAQSVKMMREAELDIVVDLAGYTAHARPEILALRVAPIQVNYLGYPGTMGASFMDAIIADPVVLPEDHEQFYSERVYRLPNCYQANDNRALIDDGPVSRAEFGLPDDAFVFCCFSMNYKIDAAVLDAWTEILRQAPGSVLWLYRTDKPASVNIHREFGERGIAPDRVIFADRQAKDRHLARHKLADLFLDTFAYGAHTTASDALWAGLPVLSMLGDTFARRVGASIVKAAGMDELIAADSADYVAKAVAIAGQSGRAGELKQRLSDMLPVCPLFATADFSRDLEAVYLTMMSQSSQDGP